MPSMDYIRTKRSSMHQQLEDERPAKRILTPAGQRLSVILDTKRAKSPSAQPKISVTTNTTYCNDPDHTHIGPVQHGPRVAKKAGVVALLTGGRLGDTPRESGEEQSHNGSNLSVSVWSDKDAEKFGHVRQRRRRGVAGWSRRRLLVLVAVILALIVALAVGLGVGLGKKSSSSSSSNSSNSSSDNNPTPSTGGAQPAASDTGSSSETDAPAPSASSTLSPSAAPANFPVGSYSIIIFLDTVSTGCTSANSTWTCAPFTDYYSDPQKALTILNWQISGTKGAYKISSNGQDDTFGTTFQNENLRLLDAGKDTERYSFQISRSKTVDVTGSLGDERGSFECDYSATGIQGVLYTKMKRTYPDDTIAVQGANSPAWPYAARIEQNIAGGQGIPSCRRNGGDQVSLASQDASTLCSCLYKNWTPARVRG
ncbi:hypothetical protein NX059_009463 [Plenodomus lindquistii]|nr:hypothetical protein NX059_009463 [Plenodomus lindquistii]